MNNNLVFNMKGQTLTSSRKVAEMFDKQHKHVLRDIRNLIEEMGPVLSPSSENNMSPNLDLSKYFLESTYKDAYDRDKVQYLLTKNGFTLLAMGFRGQKALRFKLDYIAAYDAMEQALITMDKERIDLARRLAENNNKVFERSLGRTTEALEELEDKCDELERDYEELRQHNKEWVAYASSLENYIYATTGKVVGGN